MKRSLFLFRRDFHIDDNPALIEALNCSQEVIACFIFTDEQIKRNSYLSPHCLQFMLESLEDLKQQFEERGAKLYFFHGTVEEILEKCFSTLSIDAVFCNRDYTPYSVARDQKIEILCKKNRIHFHQGDDALLHPPEDTLKKDGAPYTIFTPFYKNACKLTVARPQKAPHGTFFKEALSFEKQKAFLSEILPQRKRLPIKGDRNSALSSLKRATTLKNYGVERDFPSIEGTSFLSAYLKFNVLSIREVYHTLKEAVGDNSDLIRSLYWRDFFSMIGFFYPHVFSHCFHSKFDQLKWEDSEAFFQLWCEGKTGFPLIDAGMREMNATGWMHNRVRMLAAAFLVKDLHINWRLGERYFANKLIDYDPCVNNGNWQWAASCGCDAAPYFRIFNPWRQQKNFDPDCTYIKRWIPELSSVPNKTIFQWNLQTECETSAYPLPIVDHDQAAKKALSLYRDL